MFASHLFCLWVTFFFTSIYADDTVSYDLPTFSFGLDVIDETDLDDQASFSKFYWSLLDVTERHLARHLETQGLGSLQLVTLDLALKRKSHSDDDDLYSEFTHFRADFSAGHALVDASTVQSATDEKVDEWTHGAFADSGLWLLRHEMSKDEWLERVYSITIYFGTGDWPLESNEASGAQSSSDDDQDKSSRKRDGSEIALIVLIACTSLGLSVLLLCISFKIIANHRDKHETYSKEDGSGGGSTMGDEAGSDLSNDSSGSGLCKGTPVSKSVVVHSAPSSQHGSSRKAKEQSTSPRRKAKQNSLAQKLEMLIPDLDAITEGDEDASSLASSLASVSTFFSPASITGRKTAPSREKQSPIAEERKELMPDPPSPITEEQKRDLAPWHSQANGSSPRQWSPSCVRAVDLDIVPPPIYGSDADPTSDNREHHDEVVAPDHEHGEKKLNPGSGGEFDCLDLI